MATKKPRASRKCDCREGHAGEHPVCPRCGSEETRRVRNYGRPVGNEWACLGGCGHRWERAS